jgi:hypothetical protein
MIRTKKNGASRTKKRTKKSAALLSTCIDAGGIFDNNPRADAIPSAVTL